MHSSQTYLDHTETTERTSARDSKIWGSVHRAYAIVILAVGGVASYQANDINLAVAVAILVATWSIIFQLIATTKLIHRSLMLIHASQERKALGAPPNVGSAGA
jgi:choline-glycine betaine transporter